MEVNLAGFRKLKGNFIVLVTLIIFLGGCNFQMASPSLFSLTQTVQPPTKTSTIIPDELGTYQVTIPISSMKTTAQAEIASALLEKYLEYSTTNLVDGQVRLKAYTIDKIKYDGYCSPPDKNTTRFLTEAEFSVQTISDDPSDWFAFGESVDFQQFKKRSLDSSYSCLYIGIGIRWELYNEF